MEDFTLDLVIGQERLPRTVKLDLPKFTMIGATNAGWHDLTAASGAIESACPMDFFAKDLEIIIQRSARSWCRNRSGRGP